ncbi:MAG TPA: phage Gp37/Gp68 family protein [Trebonia sp.]|jgi:protein gp37|nr:phage Gp37/Gp68 family protein [Trebonia sp.]
MSDKSKIEWTSGDDGTPGATWNPVTGCTKVSPGCDRCYAEAFAERWRGIPGHHFENGFDVTLRPERLSQPLRWKRPRRIFVNSMSDLFHESVPDEFLHRVFAVMAMASQHTFIVLTKRHARMRSLLQDDCRCGKGHVPGIHLRSAMDWAGTSHSPTYVPGVIGHDVYHEREWPLPNVWLGVSAEDQKWADIRIPALLDTPAAVRFVSAEPLLGPIDLHGLADEHGHRPKLNYWLPPGRPYFPPGEPGSLLSGPIATAPALDWLIAGGESGSGARPCEMDWLRLLRDQCDGAAVPFFCKQLGSTLGRELGAGPKGGDWDAWPDDLRVRQFPRAAAEVPA